MKGVGLVVDIMIKREKNLAWALPNAASAGESTKESYLNINKAKVINCVIFGQKSIVWEVYGAFSTELMETVISIQTTLYYRG